MRRLAKNLILATAVVSAIFFVDLELAEAATLRQINHCTAEKKCPHSEDEFAVIYLDFWSKFRDTVMPNEPQDNNPPKETRPPTPARNAPPPTPPPSRQPPRHPSPKPQSLTI